MSTAYFLKTPSEATWLRAAEYEPQWVLKVERNTQITSNLRGGVVLTLTLQERQALAQN